MEGGQRCPGICTSHDTVSRIPNPDCAENGKVLNHFSIKIHVVAKADQALCDFWVSLSVGQGVFAGGAAAEGLRGTAGLTCGIWILTSFLSFETSSYLTQAGLKFPM